jgi:hypothetical protein
LTRFARLDSAAPEEDGVVSPAIRAASSWRLASLAGVLLSLASAIARADASLPWTPSVAARHALELLADEGGLALPLSQWPLPRTAVVRALDALPRELPPALDGARARVETELRAAGDGAVSMGLRNRAEAFSGFGDESTPGSWIGVRSGTFVERGVAAQIGARVEQDTLPSQADFRLRFDDSAIAAEGFGVQLAAWAHRSWWGPGWQSSLVLGNNAPPLYGIGLQRASAGRSESRWLAWMGPWTYDFFVAENDDAIGSNVVGNRITLRPFSLLEIAITRTAQWGGRGHPNSFDSFLNMLVGRGLNANSPQEQADDPAHELAGFDFRLRCPGGVRCTAYTQLIAGNHTRNLPSDYMGLYGIESWSADGRMRVFAEFIESICGAPLEHKPEHGCAYHNSDGEYPQGYSHAGRWLGTAAGADSRVATLGWLDVDRGTLLRVHAGTIGARVGVRAESGDPTYSGRMRSLSARQSWSWGSVTLGFEFDWLRVDAPLGRQQDTRLGVTAHMPLP